MSEKTKSIVGTLASVSPPWEPPPEPMVRELPLLEVGLVCVLCRELSATQAERTLRSLKSAYPDWNELRVSQIQEYRGHIATKSAALANEVAVQVKAYLQEVFQKNHGFDLEFLREDPNESGKFVAQLDELGAPGGLYVLWVAFQGSVPVSPGVVRALDRLGLMRRTSSMRKAQAALESKVPSEERAAFAMRVGHVVGTWCDAKRPVCWECVLVEVCPNGKKVHKEWKAQQKRLEQQRKREAERQAREEERERKRREAEEKRRAKELAREEAKRKREEAKRKREEERKRKIAARTAAKVAAAAKKKKEAAKAAAKKKKEAARKKVAAAKKKASLKKKAAAKKKAAKKPAKKAKKKKKKKTSKKKPAQKSTKKKTKKRPAKKKKTTKKRTAKKKGGRSRR